MANPQAPPSTPLEGHFLFGLVALEARLIDANQLIQAWRERDNAALSDYMVSKGWVTPLDREEIQRRVEFRIASHQGDLRSTLHEAVNPDARRLLAVLDDPVLAQTLCGLSGGTEDGTMHAPHGGPSTRARYQLLRLHGSGGMGQVWQARDPTLGRNVALKELRPDRLPGSDLEGRFLREAQITGQLEHPGIVPVYEIASADESQSPFYTMRFIKGRTFSQAIADYHDRRRQGNADPLQRRELLTAFVNICQTVAYANSRGVIHRDLKGQNVVLGDFGEVMVLDWGSAKVLGKADEGATMPLVSLPHDTLAEETLPGQIVGTPAYMAPEQARGDTAAIDARTDVYGLGAILYEILTGRPPFDGSNAYDILAKVISEHPPGLRPFMDDAPQALQAVCLRALAKDPKQRYQSARELAGEIHRWLADEPVRAWREPWTIRAGRWLSRHRSLVTGVGVCLTVTLLGTAVALYFINAARLDAEASHQREREHFQLALETNNLIADLADDLGSISLTQRKAVERTLALADARYHELRSREPSSAALLANHAKLWNAQARLYLEMGDSSKAFRKARDARALFEQLLQGGTNPALSMSLADNADIMGTIHERQGHSRSALDSYERSIGLVEGWTRGTTANPPMLRMLARAQTRIGSLVVLARLDARKARKYYQDAFAIRRRLVESDKGSSTAKRDLAVAWMKLAGLPEEASGKEKAAHALRQSHALWQALHQRDPTNADWRAGLLDVLVELGALSQENNKLAEALRYWQQALGLAEPVHRLDPNHIDWFRRVITLKMRIADLPLDSANQDAARARKRLQDALQWQALLESQVRADPADTRAKVLQALALTFAGVDQMNLARLQVERQDYLAAAVKSLEHALHIRAKLRDQDPDNYGWAQSASAAYYPLSVAFQAKGDAKAAANTLVQGYRARLAWQRRRAQGEHANLEWQQELAQTHFLLAGMLNGQRQSAEAREILSEGIGILERLVKRPQAKMALQELLAQGHDWRANACGALGDRPAQIEDYRRAIAIRRRLAAAAPGNPNLQRGLLFTFQHLQMAFRFADDHVNADKIFQESRPTRMAVIRQQLAGLLHAKAQPTSRGLAELRAQHAPRDVEEAREILANTVKLYQFDQGMYRSMEVIHAHMDLAEAFAAAANPDRAEVCRQVREAARVYRQLDERKLLTSQERTLLEMFSMVLRRFP